jgi:hypothetical protein
VTDIARFIPDKFNKLFFCNTIQHNTIQYNAIQYSTIRYNIIQLKLVNKNKRSRKSCYWQSEIFAKYRVSTPGCSNHLFSVSFLLHARFLSIFYQGNKKKIKRIERCIRQIRV